MGKSRHRRKTAQKKTTVITSPKRAARDLQKLIDRVQPMIEARPGNEPNIEKGYHLLKEYFPLYGNNAAWCEVMGLAALNMHRMDEAEFYLLQAIKREPNRAAAYSYLGFAYFEQADFLKAIEYQRKAIELQPKIWQHYLNLSQTLEKMGLYDQALAAITTAFQLTKGRQPRVLWELGNLYLCFGRIEEGWKLYEAGFGCGRRTPPLPRNDRYWGGEDIADKTILVWREHGLGDEIRNADLYHDLVAHAGQVLIECAPRLETIFARTFPQATIVPQAPHPPSTERPPFDVHSGQFSLHYHFRKTIEAYEKAARPDGHLKPDPEKVAMWRGRFAELGAKAVVGISWTSGLRIKIREHNYFDLTDLGDLLRTPDVAFVNLFYGEAEEDIRAAEEAFGVRIHRWPGVDLKNDMETVFAMTKAMDLVISAPTSAIDIAGAVGTPAWTALPPRHYVRLGTDHIPQLPSVRVFDKRLNEPWGPTLARITRAFHAWLAERDSLTTHQACVAG